MSRAEEYRAQYTTKINKVGQWIAFRHYSGTAGTRTFSDTPAKAYVLYQQAKEFVGATTQTDLLAIVLADGLTALPTTNDKLMTGFYGCGDLTTPPVLNEDGHITASGAKESAIKSVSKRAPNGVVIALEVHAVG